MNINKYVVFLLSVVLTACGGGGGSDASQPPPPNPAQGFWNGTTNTNRTISGVVLDNGTYYFVYSIVGDPNFIGGFTHGTLSASNGTFSSSDGRDFSFEDFSITPGSATGSYVARQSFGGSVVSLGGADDFTTTFDPDYDLVPTIANVTGTFTGQSPAAGGAENVSVTVSGNGSFVTASAGGCNSSGTLSPRSIGNVFNLTVTFGANCVAAGQTSNGIAVYDADTDQVIAAALNAARTDASFFIGKRCGTHC